MFKNVGKKIRIVSIIFFVLMCIASLLLLVVGIVNGVMLEWAWPIIGGVIAASVGFVVSLVSTYMVYGYGTLIKSSEENARTNKEILELLRENADKARVAEYDNARTNKDILELLRNNSESLLAVLNKKESEPVSLESCTDAAEETVEALANEAFEIEAPTVEDPVVEEPVVEEPVIEEPIVEEPIIEEPVIEDPIVEEPSVEFVFSEELSNVNERDLGEEKTLVLPKNNEPLVKRCPSCGNVVRPQANFCNQCGHKMK